MQYISEINDVLQKQPSHPARYKLRAADQDLRREKQTATLLAHQPLARIAFLALIGMLLYLSTVAYNTTHLDLLLNTKVGVIWSLVELPRRWVLGVGALVLAIVHYEAISLHHRIDRQFQAWYASLPADDTKKHLHLLWLHGGLISDQYGGLVFGRLLPTLSLVVTYGVLWIAPVITLTFLQAVVMPVHSEWLSGSVRLALVLVVVLVGYSAIQRAGRRKTKKIFLSFIRTDRVIAAVVCSVALFASFHVFLWPGELLQRAQAYAAPSSMVWDPNEDDGETYRSFLGMTCGLSHDSSWRAGIVSDQPPFRLAIPGSSIESNAGDYAGTYPDVTSEKYNDLSNRTRSFDTSKPQSDRAIFPSTSSWYPANGVPTLLCPQFDEKTVISTQILRGWMALNSRYASPNYELSDEVINGRNLTVEERNYLSTHTKTQPLHPKFAETLYRINNLDLVSEDLRFERFCNAWMPKVLLPPPTELNGTAFCGAKMQGTLISNWNEESAAKNRLTSSRLNGIDLSGGSLFNSQLGDVTISFTAIDASIEGLVLNGVNIQNSDWRLSRLTNPLFLLSKRHVERPGSSISESNFDGAAIAAAQFHATKISSSSFVGAEMSNALFFKGTKIDNSDFSLVNLAGPANDYDGSNLVQWKDSKLNFTRFRVKDAGKHTFAKTNGTSLGRSMIVGATTLSEPTNPIGPYGFR